MLFANETTNDEDLIQTYKAFLLVDKAVKGKVCLSLGNRDRDVAQSWNL